MAPMDFNPSDKVEGDYDALKKGRYYFKVDSAQEAVFASGNKGIKAKLLVGYEGRDVPCFVNLAYVPKALWRVEQFLDAIGFNFEKPPEVWELVGKRGVADFDVNEKGYFEAKKFLDPVEKAKFDIGLDPKSPPVSRPQPAKVEDEDNLPF